MKYLFAPNTMSESSEADALKILLEKEDIPCLIRNEHLSMAVGEIPPQECLPELWVLNDVDYPRAYELVEAWRSSPVETHSQWLCSDCGETIEGQFTSCWKCGSQRDEA
jgi:putative signal transducing protein